MYAEGHVRCDEICASEDLKKILSTPDVVFDNIRAYTNGSVRSAVEGELQ